VHQYASELTATPTADFPAVANARNLHVKIKSNFGNYEVKILSFMSKIWLL